MKKKRNANDVMDSIAGREFTPYRAQYAGGENGLSDIANKIERLLRDCDLSTLTSAQIDHLGRILSGGKGMLWNEVLLRSGITIRDWKPKPNDPSGANRYGTYSKSWLDHLSRRINKEGEVTFISEPYGLTAVALQELVQLLDAGWNVSVDACFSTHFPGRTLAVEVSKVKSQDASCEAGRKESAG